MQGKIVEELDRRCYKEIEKRESGTSGENRSNEKEPKRQKNGLLSVIPEMIHFCHINYSNFIIKHISHECILSKFLLCLATFCTLISLLNFTLGNMSNAIYFDDLRKVPPPVSFSCYSYQDSFPAIVSVLLDFECILFICVHIFLIIFHFLDFQADRKV